MMRVLGYPLAALLAASLLLAGCGGAANIAAPTPLGDISNPQLQPRVLWSSDGGDGTQGDANGLRLALDGNTLYVANNDGEVAAFDVATGDSIWRSQAGQRLISGPTVAGDVLLLGTRDGDLLAVSKNGGEQRWQSDVDSEVIAAPAATNGIAVVRTLDGRLAAYEVGSGNRLWTVERNVPNLTMRGASSPVMAGGRVYAGLDNGHVIALDTQTGQQFWEQTVALPTGRSDLERLVDIDAGLQIVDDQLYAVSIGDKLAALSLGSGRVRWKQDVASATGLAFGPKFVFTTDLDGVVHAVNRLTGAVAWTQDALKYRELSAPAMVNGYLLVGDYEGYLHWLDPRTGRIVGRIDALDSAIRTRPLIVGDTVLVLGVEGEVVAVQATAHG